jgi:hypothetical protein
VTVRWLTNRGKHWPEPGYAIPCPTCNVEIGKACLSGFTHPGRNDRAAVFGFVAVADAPLLADAAE